MPDKEEKKIIDILTDHVLKTRFEDLDQGTVDNAKRRILDMIGDAIGGAMCPGSPELAAMVKGWGGEKSATILGFGTKATVHEAAMVNCIFGRSFDRGPLTVVIDGNWGPYSIFINGKYINRFASHFTETTALTALALGESRGINGKELITAMVMGDDLSARLHIASDRTPPGQAANPDLPRPPVTHGSTDTFGAAAITGRLLGLNHTQMKNAFGLCVTFMGGGYSAMAPPAPPARKTVASPPSLQQNANPGWLGVKDPFFIAAMARGGYEETTSTKLMQGLIARNGVNAAQLAQAGWTGVNDAFFGERGGFYPGTASVAHPERVTLDLGKRFFTEQVFKPWPGGRPTNGPTEAALLIVKKNNINPEDIEEAVLHLSRAAAAVHYSKPYLIGDYPTMNALWSFYFAVGSTLYRKSSKDENFTEKAIREPGLQAMIKRVRLDDLEKATGIELEVKLKDGRRFTEYVDQVTGEPYKPLEREGLIAKFMEQVEFSKLVSKQKAEKLVNILENLEKLDDVRKITELAIK
jgi:2-methylcitrate dehydratase PrpD